MVSDTSGEALMQTIQPLITSGDCAALWSSEDRTGPEAGAEAPGTLGFSAAVTEAPGAQGGCRSAILS